MRFEEHKATQDIIQRLQDRIQDVNVTEFPANPEMAFRSPVFATGEICVRFYDSVYADPVPNAQGVIVQSRTARFQAHIRARDWSQTEKKASAVALMAAVRLALAGWSLPDVDDAGKFAIAQDGFLDEMPGIFFAHVVVKCTVPFEEGA